MKVRRTYNLPEDLVVAVKALVEEDHVAPTQDALVEAALRHYRRVLEEQEESRRWAEAAADPEFRAEMDRLWTAYAGEDRAAWDR